MKLEEYETIEEKEKHFFYVRIDTMDKFNEIFTFHEGISKANKKGLFYRGLSNSKYKLYNSAQREFITKELQKRGIEFHQMISDLIGIALKTNLNTLGNYLTSLSIGGNHLAILSFLQHYGAPTPLS